jgi:hypothetical protein
MQLCTRLLKLLDCCGRVGTLSVGKPGTLTTRVGSEAVGTDVEAGPLACTGEATCTGGVAAGGVLDPIAGITGGESEGAVTVGGGLGCGALPTRIGGMLSVADGMGGAGAALDVGNGGAAGGPTWAATGVVKNSNIWIATPMPAHTVA